MTTHHNINRYTVQTVAAQTLQKFCRKSHGKERLKRKALKRPQKTDVEGVDVTCWGRLFQVRAAATGTDHRSFYTDTIIL